MTTRNEIIECAHGYIGTPFRHQGRSRIGGLDCVGLIVRISQDLKLSNYDFNTYSAEPNPNQFMEVARGCPDIERINLWLRRPGDFLTISLPSYPCHVAIISYQAPTEERIIHALASVGAVTEHRLDDFWLSRARECYRFRGVED